MESPLYNITIKIFAKLCQKQKVQVRDQPFFGNGQNFYQGKINTKYYDKIFSLSQVIAYTKKYETAPKTKSSRSRPAILEIV